MESLLLPTFHAREALLRGTKRRRELATVPCSGFRVQGIGLGFRV